MAHQKIQLLPFGGVAELEEHGNKSLKEELVVVIAGPIQHIWMMAIGYMLFEAGWLHAELYYFFMWNNIIILAFNLLPIWPLDGGKYCLTYYHIVFLIYKHMKR